MKKICVSSKNPVKINSTQEAFIQMFPQELFEITGISVESNVSDQPMSNDETFKGAFNRAKNAQKTYEDADYWVGIEGGLEDVNGETLAFAWVVVIDKAGKVGKGRSGTFVLPNRIAEFIREGYELGDADDKVFGLKNSKQANGAVGILTGDVITRTTLYVPAVALALIPFKNGNLY